MSSCFHPLLAALLLAAAAAQAQTPADPVGFASHPLLAPLSARAVLPAAQAVRFRQTQFSFRAGRLSDSDWGQVEVDKAALRRVLGAEGGYVNVALYTPGQAAPAWVVDNLRIVPDGTAARDGIGTAALAAEGLDSTASAVPMAVHVDLRPGVRGSGRLTTLYAAVVVSPAPLPTVDRVWNILRQVPPAPFAVTPVTVNAEGADTDTRPATTPGALALGDPPQPVQPVPERPGDLAYPTEVYQYELPNVHAALNQCVPMAMANVVGYLRLRYNKPPLSWALPHHSTPGIGRKTSVGDVIFWQPEPSSSRVAQIDARTRREGVLNFDSGEGSTLCKMLRATFNYMSTQGTPGMVSFTHQDSHPVIGAAGICDEIDVTLSLGGYTSTQQGPRATWDWIHQQLQAGRGVMMSFGRYDVAGKRTGGHAVRIWGARRLGGRDYLYTLDDGDQGLNSTGLRTEQWQVADQHQPGHAGMPNGRLELSDLPWEIEFVIALEAKPTLWLP